MWKKDTLVMLYIIYKKKTIWSFRESMQEQKPTSYAYFKVEKNLSNLFDLSLKKGFMLKSLQNLGFTIG